MQNRLCLLNKTVSTIRSRISPFQQERLMLVSLSTVQDQRNGRESNHSVASKRKGRSGLSLLSSSVSLASYWKFRLAAISLVFDCGKWIWQQCLVLVMWKSDSRPFLWSYRWCKNRSSSNFSCWSCGNQTSGSFFRCQDCSTLLRSLGITHTLFANEAVGDCTYMVFKRSWAVFDLRCPSFLCSFMLWWLVLY